MKIIVKGGNKGNVSILGIIEKIKNGDENEKEISNQDEESKTKNRK